MAGAMFTGNRFVSALRLGFEGREELALQELKTLHAEGLNDEERGWVVLYEVRFLGQLLRVSEARKRLAELSKLWGSTPEHDVRMAVAEAVLYEMEGNPSQTLSRLNQIVKEYSGPWDRQDLREAYEEIQANRGRLLVNEGRWKEALPLLEETLRSEKEKSGQFYYNLGYCYFMAKKWDESERWLREALGKDLHPAIASATHFYMGRLQSRKQAFSVAIVEFQAAEKFAIESGISRKAIYAEMAAAYKNLGQMTEANRYAELARSAQ
jgi:tetratricopeptide (TPR) repeat protein